MKTLQLRVQDEFLDELLKMLPHDKVKVVDQKFLDDQKKLHEGLDAVLSKKDELIPYHEEMKTLNDWIEKGKE